MKMEKSMRLEKVQQYLNERGWKFEYNEVEDLGSIDFEYRGINYHIWEFLEGEAGAESNVRTGGRHEDFLGDYEEQIVEILKMRD